jgi:hypothetical protein
MVTVYESLREAVDRSETLDVLQLADIVEKPTNLDIKTNALDVEQDIWAVALAADEATQDREATLTYHINVVGGGGGDDAWSPPGGGDAGAGNLFAPSGGEKKAGGSGGGKKARSIASKGAYAFAEGGVSPGGLALVGEEGPELVSLPRGATVMSARTTQALMPELGGGDTITNILNITVEGVDDATSFVRELRRELRAQGLDFAEVQ